MPEVTKISSFGFTRGAVVREATDGPNMLVVRGLGETTVVIVTEGDDGGQLRLRERSTASLHQVLPAGDTGHHIRAEGDWEPSEPATFQSLLAAAAARARREALEEAARRVLEIEHESGELGIQNAQYVIEEILDLRAATPPEARQTEARQTETGWKLVPEEPTKEMLSFWGEQIINGRGNYRAMLAAAPPPPAIGNLEGEGRS